MIINNGQIELNHALINIGMDYSEVENKIYDVIYTKQRRDERGIGIIIVTDEDFYGLFGTVTLYFFNEKLQQISITPAWHRYDLNDEKGNRLNIIEAVREIALLSKDGLRKAFGPEQEITEHGASIFKVGKMDISAAISGGQSYGENYYVVIK